MFKGVCGFSDIDVYHTGEFTVIHEKRILFLNNNFNVQNYLFL